VHLAEALSISKAQEHFQKKKKKKKKARRTKQGMQKQQAMSITPKLWPEPGELHEWIGEANLSRDENAVVIAVSAEAVLNDYAQWYDSHWEASVKIADLAALEHRLCKAEEEMAVWNQRCDHLFTISKQTAKLQDRAPSQNLIVQKIKPHEPKRFDGSQD